MRDTYQFTPLHSAANGGHVRAIRKLIQFAHDVDVKDYLGARAVPYLPLARALCAVRAFFSQNGACLLTCWCPMCACTSASARWRGMFPVSPAPCI